jgi:hypothetical protein
MRNEYLVSHESRQMIAPYLITLEYLAILCETFVVCNARNGIEVNML